MKNEDVKRIAENYNISENEAKEMIKSLAGFLKEVVEREGTDERNNKKN